MESINIQHDIIMRLPNELSKLIYEKYNKMIVKKNKKDELTLYKKNENFLRHDIKNLTHIKYKITESKKITISHNYFVFEILPQKFGFNNIQFEGDYNNISSIELLIGGSCVNRIYPNVTENFDKIINCIIPSLKYYKVEIYIQYENRTNCELSIFYNIVEILKSSNKKSVIHHHTVFPNTYPITPINCLITRNNWNFYDINNSGKHKMIFYPTYHTRGFTIVTTVPLKNVKIDLYNDGNYVIDLNCISKKRCYMFDKWITYLKNEKLKLIFETNEKEVITYDDKIYLISHEFNIIEYLNGMSFLKYRF